MVREPVRTGALSKAGDTFRMNMHHDEWGDYQMHNEVVEFQAGARLVWAAARVEAAGPEQQEVLRSASYRWGFEFLPDGPDTTLVTETFDCTRSPDELREAVREGEGWRGTRHYLIAGQARSAGHDYRDGVKGSMPAVWSAASRPGVQSPFAASRCKCSPRRRAC